MTGSHAALVQHMHLSVAKNAVVLSVMAQGDCQIEIWGVEVKKLAFEKVFGKKLELEIIEAEFEG